MTYAKRTICALGGPDKGRLEIHLTISQNDGDLCSHLFVVSGMSGIGISVMLATAGGTIIVISVPTGSTRRCCVVSMSLIVRICGPVSVSIPITVVSIVLVVFGWHFYQRMLLLLVRLS